MATKKKGQAKSIDKELLSAVVELTGAVKELKTEVARGKENSGGDERGRTRPATANGAPREATPSKESGVDGRAGVRDIREDVRQDPRDRQARDAAQEIALNSGVDSAVSSYSPPGAPDTPPSRDNSEKLIWDVGDLIPCQKCKEPVFHVLEKITTLTKVKELKDKVEPYSERIPTMKDHTEIKVVGGVCLPCPLCFEPWGVVFI